MTLARLCRDQGKRDAACDLLAPNYGWFTEGFDTRDLSEDRNGSEGAILRARRSPPRRHLGGPKLIEAKATEYRVPATKKRKLTLGRPSGLGGRHVRYDHQSHHPDYRWCRRRQCSRRGIQRH
jgi:hypothetical protein